MPFAHSHCRLRYNEKKNSSFLASIEFKIRKLWNHKNTNACIIKVLTHIDMNIMSYMDSEWEREKKKQFITNQLPLLALARSFLCLLTRSLLLDNLIAIFYKFSRLFLWFSSLKIQTLTKTRHQQFNRNDFQFCLLQYVDTEKGKEIFFLFFSSLSFSLLEMYGFTMNF